MEHRKCGYHMPKKYFTHGKTVPRQQIYIEKILSRQRQSLSNQAAQSYGSLFVFSNANQDRRTAEGENHLRIGR